jgi:multidrug efflux system outer membrane protein
MARQEIGGGMIWQKITGVIVAASVLLSASVAQARTLSFDEALSIALNENPELLSLQNQSESLKAQAAQALSPSNPIFFVNRTDSQYPQPFNKSGITSMGASIALGFPGKAILQRRSIRYHSEGVSQQARAKEIALITDLSDIYAALAINAKLHGVLSEERRRVKTLLPVAQEQFKVGKGSETDVLNLKVVDGNLAVELVNLDSERNTLLARFRQVINHPNEMDFEPLIPKSVALPAIDQTPDRLVAVLEVNRPGLKAVAAQRKSAEASLKRAKMSPLPDFILSGQVNNAHSPAVTNLPGYQRTYSFGGGISIPIFYPANEHYGIKAAKRDLDVARHQERNEYLVAVSDLHVAFSNLQTAKAQVRNYSHLVVPAARANYDLVTTNYSVGKMSYVQLNDARDDWLKAQRGYLTTLLSGVKLFNMIVREMGCDPSGTAGYYACVM